MIKIRILLTAFFFLYAFGGVLKAQKNIQKTSHVNIRIIEENTNQVTSAMVCITGADGKIRVPPSGVILDTPSATKFFYSGIKYKKDKNWVGPVRKTNGLGNQNEENRSTRYHLLPSIPYWREPVMYQTSGDFTISLPAGKWQISIEHGNEFVPVREEFDVQDNKGKQI